MSRDIGLTPTTPPVIDSQEEGIKEATRVLDEIEWVPWQQKLVCPLCRFDKLMVGHSKDCALAALLARHGR